MSLEGSFSFHPSCSSLDSTLDVVSNIFLWCGHQCCNWLQQLWGSLLWCAMVFVLLYFPPFHFSFPSLEDSWCSFFFEPLGYPFFWPMFSKYHSYTHPSSTFLGLKSVTCFRTRLCTPPKYLRSTFCFLGEIPNLMDICFNGGVYSYILYPYLYLK